MNRGKGRRARAALLACLLFTLLCPTYAADSGMERGKLQKLRARIDALQDKLNETRGRRDAVRDQVRDIERRIGDILNSLRQTDAQLRTNEKQLAGLRTRAAREQGGLRIQRQQLRRQVYMAYVMGRQEYPKMLLNQQNPASVARVLTYYRYFNHARTERIGSIETTLARLDTTEQQIQDQSRVLETLRADVVQVASRRGAEVAGHARRAAHPAARGC